MGFGYVDNWYRESYANESVACGWEKFLLRLRWLAFVGVAQGRPAEE